MSVGQMLGGLIFLKTNIRNTLVDFFYQRIGMSPWLEQPNISIMKHGNMILGFHQISKPDMEHPDLHGMITFVYPSTEHVDVMYQKLLDIADEKPGYNERSASINFLLTIRKVEIWNSRSNKVYSFSVINQLLLYAYTLIYVRDECGNTLHRHILPSPAPVANNPDTAELLAQSIAVTLFS